MPQQKVNPYRLRQKINNLLIQGAASGEFTKERLSEVRSERYKYTITEVKEKYARSNKKAQ